MTQSIVSATHTHTHKHTIFVHFIQRVWIHSILHFISDTLSPKWTCTRYCQMIQSILNSGECTRKLWNSTLTMEWKKIKKTQSHSHWNYNLYCVRWFGHVTVVSSLTQLFCASWASWVSWASAEQTKHKTRNKNAVFDLQCSTHHNPDIFAYKITNNFPFANGFGQVSV